MRILIDIGHPAHVHLFKNLAWQLIDKGHKVLFTCRDREHVVHLLKTYGFVYENFGKHYKTMKGKLYGLAKNELQILDTALRFKPDMFISHGSTIAAHTSFLVRKPHIALEDTFNMEQVRLSMPFTDVVLTGDYEHPSLGKKEIRYPGYHELAYLHPNVFTPNENILTDLGVEKGEKYAIVRFVAWAATHDVGNNGISIDDKLKLIASLSSKMRVFISSEAELPIELKPYQMQINPEDIHSVLAFASLFIGESGTMATECAMLGTPNIIINPLAKKLGIHIELSQKYHIQDFFDKIDEAWEQVIYYMNSESLKMQYEEKIRLVLQDKIDVTRFLNWFIINYPRSRKNVLNAKFQFQLFR